jgi:hypothetical protein
VDPVSGHTVEKDAADDDQRSCTCSSCRHYESANAENDVPTDDQLIAAGFRKRYVLCGHPAYPDPLWAWPATEENAARLHREYCSETFEEYVARIGFTPHGLTAKKFNPRVLITWEYVGEKRVFSPGGSDS